MESNSSAAATMTLIKDPQVPDHARKAWRDLEWRLNIYSIKLWSPEHRRALTEEVENILRTLQLSDRIAFCYYVSQGIEQYCSIKSLSPQEVSPTGFPLKEKVPELGRWWGKLDLGAMVSGAIGGYASGAIVLGNVATSVSDSPNMGYVSAGIGGLLGGGGVAALLHFMIDPIARRKYDEEEQLRCEANFTVNAAYNEYIKKVAG